MIDVPYRQQNRPYGPLKAHTLSFLKLIVFAADNFTKTKQVYTITAGQGGENEFRKCLMASIGYLGWTVPPQKCMVVFLIDQRNYFI